ncbi:MAG: hypothetical protein IE909_01830 [Campylobacterales bacterium]|nr:hypothetical protein [Campylobacterales bacterium]
MITKIQTKEVFKELRETINNIKIIGTILLLMVGLFVLIYIYNIEPSE